MSTPKQRRPGRDHLVATAMSLFARHGVSDTSLQKIADEAGVTKAAVYHHFRSKDLIVSAVMEPVLVEIDASVRRAAVIDDPDARLDALLNDLAEQAVTHHDLYAIVLRDVAMGRLSDRALAIFSQLESALAGHAPTPGRQVRVAMFLSGLIGPAVDPRISDVDTSIVKSEILAVGRALLSSCAASPREGDR
ncbi:TetR/AcrR family transcriptional regulator [Demequina aurantiaca]|uniref:TetR/AcrR family transcriptional regulator n=1 Tax=Demequina aurantiaca TaxID=676200 RepID=UPI003D32A850